ncbi:kynurenine formamidase isoform X2 [Daktulosphaira vitifoliae]|uniref:kynurenine formamidase isoform X2 n=1 Tax=Daktulosphaira vitifoliae TaxID=58002 RepID=UPI0021A9C6CC|nr:kynurenine formamidase isoform X2 [Daktulosphaira vitifoliae]
MNEKYENEVLYSPSKWCKRIEHNSVVKHHINTVRKICQKIKTSQLNKSTNIRYGLGDQQLLDIYENKSMKSNSSTPSFVYIHGGYWQELEKDISAYCVEPLINSEIRVIVPGYDLAPKSEIIDEIRQLLSFLVNNLMFENIWLGGHSAGAHLAACMILTAQQDFPEIKGFVLISGIYDLKPLLDTSINSGLQLNETSCVECSPLHILKGLNKSRRTSEILIVTAEDDSPAFKQQTSQFRKFLVSRGLIVKEECVAGVDHFNIVENLSDKDFFLTKLIIKFILNSLCSKD